MIRLSCIVLAGGKSLRMGRDKVNLEIGGKSFFQRALENARSISSDVIVSVGSEAQVENVGDAAVVVDEVRGRGPLYALLSSLKRCSEEHVALLPVDVPLLNTGIYGLMAAEMERDPSLEAVIPCEEDGLHPLLGIYLVRNFLSACRKAASEGRESVVEAISNLQRVKKMDVGLFKEVDPKLLSFHNVNTPEDLKLLEEKLRWPEEDPGTRYP